MKSATAHILGLMLLAAPLAAHGPVHETIATLEKELTTSPDNPAILLRLSELYRIHGDPDKAARCLKQVDKDTHPEAYLIQARILVDQGQSVKAIETLDACTQAHPDSSDGWFQLAALLSKNDRIKEAADAQEEGLRITPTTISERLTAALLREQAGDPDRALQLLEQTPGESNGLQIIGFAEARARLLFNTGKRQDAFDTWEALREKEPALAFRWWKIEGDMTAITDPARSRSAYQRALAQLEERFEHREPPLALKELMAELSTP